MNRSFSTSVTAFSLVEAACALGICAFCLLAIFALLPAGLKSSQTATEQTVAAGLLSMVAVDLRETPAARGKSAFFEIPVPANPVTVSPDPTVRFFNESAESFADLQPDSRYRLTVKFLPNGGYDKMATLADVLVTWPAQAGSAAAAGRVRTLVAIDRN